MQSDEKFLCKNSLPDTANIWRALEVDKNIVTQIFYHKNFANKINTKYGKLEVNIFNIPNSVLICI